MIDHNFRKNKKKLKKVQKFIELIVIDSVNKIWTPDASFFMNGNFLEIFVLLDEFFWENVAMFCYGYKLSTVLPHIFASRFWAH